MDDLYSKLSEILEVDAVKPDDAFEDYQMWDSLSRLSVIAMVESSYGVVISGQQLSILKTIKDLESYIASKK